MFTLVLPGGGGYHPAREFFPAAPKLKKKCTKQSHLGNLSTSFAVKKIGYTFQVG